MAIRQIGTPEIKAELEKHLIDYKSHELGLYFNQLPEESVAGHIVNNFYFKDRYLKRLNNYPAGLAFGQ